MPRRLPAVAAALGALALALTACSGTSTSASSAQGDDLGLVSAGTLTVATEGTYRPFSFHDESGTLTGYDVEIAQEAVANPQEVVDSIEELKSENRRNALLMLAAPTGELRFVTVRID